MLTPGAATVVALNKTTQVVGFAHALANGVTVYLAISLKSLWRLSAPAGASDARSWLRPSSGAALAA